MKYKFEIDKRLMGLNEYTKLNRENRYLGNQAKQKEQAYIMWCIKEQLGDLKIDEPVIGHFTWVEENKRRDLYEHFDRLSCWCCPLKNLKELRILYKYYPDLWEQLKDMDNRSYNQFRADYSVEQLENKFITEEGLNNE